MLDWRTGEEEWEATEEPQGQWASQSRTRPPIPRWLWLLFGILVLGITGAGIALRWKARQQTARLVQDIQATVDTESWARETHNLRLYRSLLDPAAHPGWRERQEQEFLVDNTRTPARMTVVDAMVFGGDLAVVELEVEPASGPAYRVTRAYRRSGGMWLETSIPGSQVWLDQDTRETQHLRFIFHRRDAARIAAIIPDIQALYVQLLGDLVLSPPQGKRTLYVILSVRPIESELVNDPTYYDLSDLGPDAAPEAVKRRLGALLIQQIMNLFRTERGDLPALVQSVGEWEYADWLGMPLPDPRVSPRQDLLVSVPFLSLLDESWKSLEQPEMQAIVGQALVDYTVQAYGRDSLSSIVRGAQLYGAHYPFVTQVLQIPQVLGVPFMEFNAGWRDYALHTFTHLEGQRLGLLTTEKSELLRVLTEEERAVEEGNLERYDRLLSPHTTAEWREQAHRRFHLYQQFQQQTNAPYRLRLEDAIIDGDDALLRLQVHFPDPGSTAYQEIRTYHRFDDGWKWASTLASFWGLTEEAETPHLRLHFNRQDAETIREELPATESFFQQVSRDLLTEPEAETRSKIEINVVPNYQVLNWLSGQQGIGLVARPWGTFVTVELLPPSRVSFRGLDLRDGNPVAARRGSLDLTPKPAPQLQILSPTLGAIATDISPASFYRMAAGLTLSRYLITSQAGLPETPFSAAVYDAIARWETEQWATELPWTAPRRQAINTLLQTGAGPSLRSRPTWTEQHVDPATGYLYDTVLAYVAGAYGRTSLGKLVAGASRHAGWDTLIPDVLGVRFGDFEAGWRASLQP
ncbi:MAG: nuclear transport factor 2 family protein [Chloroflexi bacterium]|nr:MAG: nuclear transport factor 2 family protein [Chloroflexota bacterium]